MNGKIILNPTIPVPFVIIKTQSPTISQTVKVKFFSGKGGQNDGKII